MKDENLINIWKRSDFDVRFEFDKDSLVKELKTKVSTIDRNIKIRNFIEILVAVLFMPVFAYLLYEVPYYLFKLGCFTMLLWLFYLIYKLVSIRKYKPKNQDQLSLKLNLNNQKIYLYKEIDLLNSVLYWYLLPPFIGQILMLLGLNFHRQVEWNNQFLLDFLPTHIISQIAYMIFLTLLYYWIYKKNKAAIEKDIRPIIKEIDQLEYKFSNT
jgi:hypothetical protein